MANSRLNDQKYIRDFHIIRTLLFKIQHTVTVDIDVSFLYYAMNKLIAIPDN